MRLQINNHNMATAAEIRESTQKEAIEYQSKKFPNLELKKGTFYAKPVYEVRGVKCVSMYDRELTSNYYMELVQQQYAGPYSPERTLYKWNGNKDVLPQYKSQTEDRYHLPISELVPVKPDNFSDELEDIMALIDSDGNMRELTIKDHCAIIWKKPVSEKEWLNNLIKQTFKD